MAQRIWRPASISPHTANGSSAVGASSFILYAPEATAFSLTYNGPEDAREGTVTLTFLKLRAPPDAGTFSLLRT